MIIVSVYSIIFSLLSVFVLGALLSISILHLRNEALSKNMEDIKYEIKILRIKLKKLNAKIDKYYDEIKNP